MIEPSKVLSSIKQVDFEENPKKSDKRSPNSLYSTELLGSLAAALFDPPLENERPAKRAKLPELEDSEISLDLEYLEKLCTDTRFFITPSQGGLDYMRESLELFQSCLLSLPNFELKEGTPNDTESYFNNLMESFFEYLEKEKFYMELEADDVQELSANDQRNLTKVEFTNESDKPLIRQLFKSVLLAYNWALKLFKHSETALEIAKSDLKEFESDTILSTSLGLKEANRNYVFYNHISQQMWEILNNKDKATNSFISEFLERISFMNSIANTEMSYEPQYWNKLKLQMEKTEKQVTVFPINNEHEENLNLIRNEMTKRISGKSKCEYLRRELEKANTEYTQWESKNEEIINKLDSLKKQLKELPNILKVEIAPGKWEEFKRLPKKLFSLMTHLHNFTLSNPLREVTFKTVKENSEAFVMTLLAPKDLLFPSMEATKFVFPMGFQFYLEDNGIRVKQTNNTKMSTSKKIVELVMNKFMGLENEEEIDLGIRDFENQLPEQFHDQMEKLYKLAQEFVWNLYILESYKSNNKLIISKILPSELQRNTESKYTHKEKNVWTLSNEAASVKVQVDKGEEGFEFSFTEFEKKGKLKDPEESKLAEHLKKVKGFELENLKEIAKEVLEYFKSGNDLIQLAVLFEAYAVIFDFMST